jgi:hypothetical protein
MISLAYSRISLKDICLKLHLDSEEDTEYIVAKAIRDGVIDAEVDHENGWMKSTEVGDLYGTDEPRKRFQARIDYCNQLHNESVKVSLSCQYTEDTANLLVIGDAISPEWPETRYVVFPHLIDGLLTLSH